MINTQIKRLFFFLLFAVSIKAQTATLTFTWMNTNTTQVFFDIMEVKAPPDTFSVMLYVNAGDAPIQGVTTYTRSVMVDEKYHYYRMKAYTVDGKESPFSNVSKIFLSSPLKAPSFFTVTIK
jgi:hypothetical protein